MTNEEMLANAPDGATHICNQGRWFKFEMAEYSVYWLVYGKYATNEKMGWISINMNIDKPYGLRALSDIRRIVELEKALKEKGCE